MTEANTPDQNSIDTPVKDFDLYKLIIEENRHLHQVWINNFRVILTFNSILLAGAFALFAILSKGESSDSTELAFAWSLRAISLIGTTVTLVGVHIVRRTKAITSLRLKEIRYLETTFKSGLRVSPFEEGAFVLGNSTKETFLKNTQSLPYPVKPLKFNPFGGLGGYSLICGSFVLAYILIFVLSFCKL